MAENKIAQDLLAKLWPNLELLDSFAADLCRTLDQKGLVSYVIYQADGKMIRGASLQER